MSHWWGVGGVGVRWGGSGRKTREVCQNPRTPSESGFIKGSVPSMVGLPGKFFGFLMDVKSNGPQPPTKDLLGPWVTQQSLLI